MAVAAAAKRMAVAPMNFMLTVEVVGSGVVLKRWSADGDVKDVDADA